jgi:hypothetical protein
MEQLKYQLEQIIVMYVNRNLQEQKENIPSDGFAKIN